MRVRRLCDWGSEAYLWQMSPSFGGRKFVITSATMVQYSGPECYMFPATADGEETSMAELWPSRRGTLDHLEIIRAAGYVPVEEIRVGVAP